MQRFHTFRRRQLLDGSRVAAALPTNGRRCRAQGAPRNPHRPDSRRHDDPRRASDKALERRGSSPRYLARRPPFWRPAPQPICITGEWLTPGSHAVPPGYGNPLSPFWPSSNPPAPPVPGLP
ncbi:hypothetical protein, partial [Mycobacterium tuberculosis]